MSEYEQLLEEVRGIRSDIREDLRDIYARLDNMTRDCTARHNDVNLQKLSNEVEVNANILREVTAERKAGMRLFDILMVIGMFLVAVIGLWGVLK